PTHCGVPLDGPSLRSNCGSLSWCIPRRVVLHPQGRLKFALGQRMCWRSLAPVSAEATSSLLEEVCQNHARHTTSRPCALTPLLTSSSPFVHMCPHGCPKTSYPSLKSTLIDGSSFYAQHTRRNAPLVSCAFMCI